MLFQIGVFGGMRNQIYPIGDQLISSSPIFPDPFSRPQPAPPVTWLIYLPRRYGPPNRAFHLTKASNPLTLSFRHVSLVAHPRQHGFFRPCLPCLYRNPLVKPIAFYTVMTRSALDRQKLTWIRRLQRRLSAVTAARPLPFSPLAGKRAPDSPHTQHPFAAFHSRKPPSKRRRVSYSARVL